MGLGYEQCRVLNPRLIYASISGMLSLVLDGTLTSAQGYGQTGPFAQAAGYDVVIEAEAGLMHMSVFRRYYSRH